MLNFRQTARAIMPQKAINVLRRMRLGILHRRNATKTTEEVFTDIYVNNKWGGSNGNFYSGAGSRDDQIVRPYIETTRKWLQNTAGKNLRFVDLGCGDFNIGQNFIDLCSHYTGVDIVAPLIAHNTATFGSERIEFQHLNLVIDDLPDGDVCFLRQVLQHLSNQEITAILPKLNKYRWVIITEHQPSKDYFKHANLDKPHGGDIRTLNGSGVFLEVPPFSIPKNRLQLLLEVHVSSEGYAPGIDPGIIRTFILSNS
jgi:SAM-dependent methyltransferase